MGHNHQNLLRCKILHIIYAHIAHWRMQCGLLRATACRASLSNDVAATSVLHNTLWHGYKFQLRRSRTGQDVCANFRSY